MTDNVIKFPAPKKLSILEMAARLYGQEYADAMPTMSWEGRTIPIINTQDERHFDLLSALYTQQQALEEARICPALENAKSAAGERE